jgi:hypothetical protein
MAAEGNEDRTSRLLEHSIEVARIKAAEVIH